MGLRKCRVEPVDSSSNDVTSTPASMPPSSPASNIAPASRKRAKTHPVWSCFDAEGDDKLKCSQCEKACDFIYFSKFY